jgi:hypothetical protein
MRRSGPEIRHRAMIAPRWPLQRICALVLVPTLLGIGVPAASAARASMPARSAAARRAAAREARGVGAVEFDGREGAFEFEASEESIEFETGNDASEFDASDATTTLSFPGDVHAGQIVELRWSTPPADVEELEVMLSLDGGRTYDVRISPEIDPRTKVWRWRVPNLPTSEARLRLRLGSRRGEREGQPTPPFTILGAGDRPIERRQVHEGRWWDGLDAFERASAPASLGASGESIQSSAAECTAALPPRASDVAAESSASGPASITNVTDSATSASDAPRAARFFPLRN